MTNRRGMDRPEDVARTIIDSNLYVTLGTADENGRPWVSPVWYASAGYAEFYWVSSPEARHSRNLATRAQVSMVVFDSRAPIGTGQAVYMSAAACELTGVELERGIEIYSRASVAGGGREWGEEEVRVPALYRLYRADVTEHWVLDPAGRPDVRIPVTFRSHGGG
jgi:hypothetical protein